MYARVVRHEDGDPEVMRSEAARLNEQMSDAPPEGVPAKAFLLLMDPDGGRSLAINLFETDDDRRRGHEVLEGMSPGEGYGRRVSVEMYEVGADLQWERR